MAHDNNGGVSAAATVNISVTGQMTCVDALVCTPTSGQELQETSCNDGVDNDCDGQTDGADCGVAVNCSDFPDKSSCNTQASCRWDNKNKTCINN